MKVQVTGDENEIEIQVGEQFFTGDLSELSEGDEGPEIWEVDGLELECEQILCLNDLEDLARQFLAARKINYNEIEVESDSFEE